LVRTVAGGKDHGRIVGDGTDIFLSDVVADNRKNIGLCPWPKTNGLVRNRPSVIMGRLRLLINNLPFESEDRIPMLTQGFKNTLNRDTD
jgi:hypothetical protein